jgi:hypothetical protein
MQTLHPDASYLIYNPTNVFGRGEPDGAGSVDFYFPEILLFQFYNFSKVQNFGKVGNRNQKKKLIRKSSF